ncbi:16332_t:CDS:2, partial [Dentiscutata erythropus]
SGPAFHSIFGYEKFQELLEDFSKSGDMSLDAFCIFENQYVKSRKLLHVDLSPEALEAWQQVPDRVKAECKKLAEDVEKGLGYLKRYEKVSSEYNVRHFAYSEFKEIEEINKVSQFANGENLRSYLKNKTTFEGVFEIGLTELLPIAEKITLGLQHLHKQNIIHKDLSPENILINDGIPKISDYGSSTKIDDNSFSLSVGACFPNYRDPQAFLDIFFEPDFASDIYSLGLILWELSSGVLPFSVFKDKMCLALGHYIIDKGFQNEIIKGTPTEYSLAYKQCWNINPQNRPGLDE